MNQEIPGKKEAVISLVLAIVGIVTGLGVILGPIGLYFASQSAKLGNDSGIRTNAYICSIVSLVLGILTLVTCLCVCSAVVIGAGSGY